MASNHHTRWQRRRMRQHSAAQRVLAFGAVIGIVATIAALVVLGNPHGGIDRLVRGALLLPVLLYVGWWLVGPGVGPARSEVNGPVSTLDAEQRLERIEAVFDAAAVPRPRREFPQLGADAPGLSEFRASIRRTSVGDVDPSIYGIGIRRTAASSDESGTRP